MMNNTHAMSKIKVHTAQNLFKDVKRFFVVFGNQNWISIDFKVSNMTGSGSHESAIIIFGPKHK